MSVFAGVILPQVIYETESPHNGKIQVLKHRESLQLRVDRFTQSVSKNTSTARKRVWGRVVDVLKEETPRMRDVLVLGLGGGTTQHFISESFPNTRITSVEIDPVMIEIAKEFFSLDEIPNHKIVSADACRVVIEPGEFGISPQSFDAAVVDIFIGDVFPELGKSGNFVAALKRLVKPGGLIVFNRLYLERHQDDVNDFMKFVEGFLNNIKSQVIAGYTNSDNILFYGRT